MGFILVFGLIFGGIYLFAISPESEKDKEYFVDLHNNIKKTYKEKENLNYLESLSSIKYLGGFKDIGKKEGISILLFDDRIRFEFSDELYRDVLKNNILNCHIENKTQIINQISMGKILCLGVFALGGNNSKEINKEYLVIDCDFKKDNISIVLEFENQMRLEKASQDINNLISDEEEFISYFKDEQSVLKNDHPLEISDFDLNDDILKIIVKNIGNKEINYVEYNIFYYDDKQGEGNIVGEDLYNSNSKILPCEIVEIETHVKVPQETNSYLVEIKEWS